MNEIQILGGVLMFFGVFFFILFAVIIFMIISYWKVYQKAGKPGWASIVPIYNIIVLLEITNKPTWWILMLFVPFANIVFGIMIIHALSKSFGQDVGFTLGLIFLPVIFYPMLAFGKYTYTKLLNETTTTTNAIPVPIPTPEQTEKTQA